MDENPSGCPWCDERKEEIASLKAQLESVERGRDEARHEIKHLNRCIRNRQKREPLEDEIRQARKERGDAIRERNEVRSALATAEEMRDCYSASLDDALVIITNIGTQNTALRKQLESARGWEPGGERDALLGEMADLRKQVEELKGELHASACRNVEAGVRLGGERDKAEARCKELAETVTVLKRDFSNAMERAGKAETRSAGHLKGMKLAADHIALGQWKIAENMLRTALEDSEGRK
jgi:chromosome segregation ATPase